MSSEAKWVGQPVERTEDRVLLTKGGHFIDDLTLSGVAHAAYVRSPHARAKIRHIDISRALDHPGVYAVITGEDVAQSTRPQRGRVPLPNSPRVYAIAYEQVRYVGEPVVGIAAVDRATAEDAADLVRVEYEPLPPVLDPEEALKPDAPLVFEEIGSNVLWHNTFPYGDVEAAFAGADTIVNERVTIHRYSSTPLETFGVMAQYEPAASSFTIWGHTQQPAQDLHVLAAAFGVSPGQIRLIIPPMGGSFGNKVRPLFIVAAALLARKAKRPVKWIEDRRESLLALGHAADGIMEMSAAVKADGTLLAIKFRNIENEGAGIDFAGRHNLLMLSNIANCYRLRAISYEGYSVVTNRCPVVANRGIGKPFMCFAVERMMDAVARTLKLDRAEIRFRNFIQPDEFPYDTPGGQTYDSGNYPEMLRTALVRVDYDTLRREQVDGRTRGRLLGIGIATAVEPGGSNLSYGMLISGPSQLLSGQGEAARVRLETDGTATVFTGGLESGQGHATALAQIVADELALHVSQVRVATTFDSASHPYVMTSGVYSNKFHGHDTVAAIGAARKVREKLLKRAAVLLEANLDDLELSDGRISVRGAPQKGVSVAKVASRAYWSLADEQPDGEPGLEALHYYSNPLAKHPDEKKRLRVQLGFASAAHVAVVEVDAETFEIKVLRYVVVHDCGRQINPRIVEGQVHGATAHGIAAALLEEFAYDRDGQLLTTSFMDYLKPTAADLPDIEGDRLETPSPLTMLGTKGVGEGGAVVAPAAIASAVEDALVPLGIQIAALPITPSRLFDTFSSGTKRYERHKN
ncbi:MAG TPA: xanthine dehydrogenase family protein molybdopterin-binding subunit [Candidatus Binatia bacterium]|nr:xanthine dehydrogenase family protein molybdopterin-binding subunit [Candidatus Binatia bacterium]